MCLTARQPNEATASYSQNRLSLPTTSNIPRQQTTILFTAITLRTMFRVPLLDRAKTTLV